MNHLTTNRLEPAGPSDAKLCFIGEAPGESEDTACEPFVGKAGQFFNRCLSQQGIIRTQVLIHNTFDQRPPRNNIEHFYEDKAKRKLTWEGKEHITRLKVWLEGLLAQRETTGRGPNVLVALGLEPMKHLTGKRRITKWRGSILPCTLVPGFKVYPTFHPSYVQRLIQEKSEVKTGAKKKDAQNVLPLFLIDLQRAMIQSDSPDIPVPRRVFHTDLSFGEIMTRLETLNSLESGTVAVDIENFPHAVIWCIGFALTPAEGFTVPIIKNQRFAWSEQEEAQIWVAISELFLNPKIKKVCQGGMHDLSILGRFYGLRVRNYGDTMYCHQATYPYIRKGLEVLTSIYTWEPYYKDEGRISLGNRTDDAQYRYNVKDCCVEREVWDEVERDSKEHSCWKSYQKQMSRLPSLLAMTIKGTKLDLARKNTLGDEFFAKAREARDKIWELTGTRYNLNSSDDKRKLLYGYLGLELQFHQKTKQVTTDKDALNKLRRKYPDKEELSLLLDYQRFNNLASNYTAMQEDPNGRIHTKYEWVSTWRLNSQESPFGGFTKEDKEGRSLQNIPKKGEEGKAIRSLFIPDPGQCILKWDMEQAEARVYAWEAEDLHKIELFNAGWDVHWYNCKMIFSIPESVKYIPQATFRDSITGEKHTLKELRDIAKTVVYAATYGMGPYMMQTILAREGFVVEFNVAKRLLMNYKTRDPFLESWQRERRRLVKETRTLISSYGRKRQFMGRFNDDLYRAVYAFSPQNTVGELMQEGCQAVLERVEYFEPLLNVHDETVGQLGPSLVAQAVREIRPLVEIPLDIKGRELIIPVEFATGPNWGECQVVK